MSGRGRLSLCAFAATLLAAGALTPLVQSASWLLEAGLLLAVVSGTGALARRVPLARSLTVLAQAVVALLLFTVVFARDSAPLGIVPTPEVFQQFSRLFAEGSDDVSRFAIPAPATDGIKLMLVGGVLVIGLAVDALAVTYRSAAPAGLPLLALYSVAAGLSGGAGGELWFLLAACGYLLLLLAEGRDRLSQWGRVFGGAPGAAARLRSGRDGLSGHALAPARTGRRIGVVALGIALAFPYALPALGSGLLGGTGNGAGSGNGGGGTISAVNPLVSLQDNLNQPTNREALRYKTNSPDPQNMYLRIMALDKFDGTSWRFSQRAVEDVPKELPPPPGLNPDVRTVEVKTNISAAPWYRQNYLPMPYPATSVKIGGKWRFEPAGRTLVGDRGQSTEGAQYTVTTLDVEPTAAQLAAAPPAPAALRREYTQVPSILPPVVKQTAEKVTAGATNNYEKAVKLQDWFAVSGGFTYNTHVDSGTGVKAITRFLKDKQGFCVHFSFAMAAMARTLGIPARVAVGFTPGTKQPDGSWSVGLQDAHAWPELYFQGVGWTRFEPTPSRGSTPDYTRPDTQAGAPSNPQQPTSTASSAPSVAPSTSSSCSSQERRLGGCGAAAQQEALPPTDHSAGTGDLALIGGGGAALLLVLALPLLWRIRVRSVRLSAGGRPSRAAAGTERPALDDGGSPAVGGPAGRGRSTEVTIEAITARTLGAWREIADTAWDHGIPPDEAQTPRKAAERIVRVGRLEGAPAAAVHRVADSVEQVLYAQHPQPWLGLAADVRRAGQGLRASAGRWTRLRALLLPRSSIRVIWAWSDRWTAFVGRWGVRRLSGWAEALRRRPSRQGG